MLYGCVEWLSLWLHLSLEIYFCVDSEVFDVVADEEPMSRQLL